MGGAAAATVSFLDAPTGGSGLGPALPQGAGRAPLRVGDPLVVDLTGSEGDWAAAESALWAALGKLQCPTLVVRGERSAMLDPRVVREMVDNVLDRGRGAVVDGAGHAIAVDNPSGLAAVIADFLAELAAVDRGAQRSAS